MKIPGLNTKEKVAIFISIFAGLVFISLKWLDKIQVSWWWITLSLIIPFAIVARLLLFLYWANCVSKTDE